MPKHYGKESRNTVKAGTEKAGVYREMGQNTYSGGGQSQKDGYSSTTLPRR